MIETISSIILMSMVVRVNRLLETKAADRLFANLMIWLPPSREAIEGTKAPQHKRSKHPPKNRTIQERLNMLGMKRGTFSKGSLARHAFYDLIDSIFLVFVLSLVSLIWQWLQSLAHPHDRLLDVSTWVVVAFCAVSLYSLIVLAWKDEFNLSKWERKAFASALGVLAGAILLALPPGTLTFRLDTGLAELSTQCQAYQDFVGLRLFRHLPDPTGAAFLLIAALCAVLAGVLINPAFHASYTYIHQDQLQREWPLAHKLLVAEPFLCLFIAITFFRPMLLTPLQTSSAFRPCPTTILGPGEVRIPCNPYLPPQLSAVLPPTDDGWLKYQLLLMLVLVVSRAMLARWQLQAYMDYGLLEFLCTHYATKELDVVPVQQAFQHRLQSVVYVGLQQVAPAAWLASLLVLLTAKVFLPMWSASALQLVSPGTPPVEPLALNASVYETLQAGNVSAALAWDMAVTLIDYPLLSPRFYREAVSFLAFYTVAVWFVCFSLAVLYRLGALSRIRVGPLLS